MLVSGKLSVPGSDRPLLDRPRLRDAIPPDLRLLLLAAPPGSGKTSLTTQWVATLPRPTAWYTLDRSDADPVTFARYLAASFATVAPTIADTLVGTDAHDLDPMVRAQVFADAVNDVLPSATLVLDDLDLIETENRLPAAIAAVLDALLLHCPHLHVIIASRHLPQLDGVVRLLASGDAAIIDGSRLNFTPDAIDQLWTQTFGAPDPHARDQLLVLCGGWATAVALAAATHRGDTPLPADNRQLLYAYLATQVLNDLPLDLQQWMEDVAVLDYLQAERCDQLLHRQDSAHYLAEVDRRNLFVVSIGEAQWRYQPLFRDFLLDRLRRDPQRYNTLLGAAATLAKRERSPQWALELAVQSGAWAIVVDLLEAAGSQLRHSGQHAMLGQWLHRVPVHILTPALWRLRAQVLQDQGQLNEALVALDQAARGSDEDRMMANVLRAQIVQQQGQLNQAAALIAPYVEDEQLPAAWRARVLRVAAVQHYQHGQYTLAQQRLQAALSLIQPGTDPLDIARINQGLGVLAGLLGDLGRAEQYYRLADAYWQQAGAVVYRCTTLNNLGMTLLERSRVSEAKEQLHIALALAQQHHILRAQALTQASLGDVAVAEQLFEEASTLYTSAHQLAAHHGYARPDHYALAQLAHTLRLQCNKVALAQLLDDVDAASPASPTEHAWIAAARAGTYWALNLPAALEAIDEALAVLPEEEQNDRAFILLLRAQILWTQGQSDAALEDFARINTVARRVANPLMFTAWVQAVPQLIAQAVEHGDPLALRLQLRMAGAGDQQGGDPVQAQQAEPVQPTTPSPAQHAAQASSAPTLVVRTLGTEHIVRDGEPTNGGGPLPRAVFFCLLAAGAQGLPAETLRTRIWGDDDWSGEALKMALKRVRRDICPVQFAAGHYALQLPVNVNYDVAQFNQLLQRPTTLEQLQQAVAVYNGPYLARLEQPWVVGLRNSLAERYVNAQVELGTLLLAIDAGTALEHFQMALQADAYHAQAMTGVLRAHAALGRRAYALDLYHAYRTHMEEQGLDPDRSVEQTYRSLLDDEG